jgi:hypothetical protein
LISDFIEFAKLKRTLLFSTSQWVNILKIVIQQDSRGELWKLYFFMAATRHQPFILLIPFSSIIKSLATQRALLEESKTYVSPHKPTKIKTFSQFFHQ